MSRKLLYRRVGSAVISILALLAMTTPIQAQMPQLKRPQEENEEKKPVKPKPKKVKGPRAIGLLQMNQSGKGSLIPIAIQVDGKFYDASVYKAEPVPMALEPGTVYEVEQTGTSQGLFTVSGALHGTERPTLSKWTGTGSYYANGTEAAKTTRKAENVPLGIAVGDSDAPPKLTRGSSKSGDAKSGDTPTPAAPETKSPSTSASTDKPSDSGKDGSGKEKGKDQQPAAKAADPATATPSSASGDKSSDAQTPESKPADPKTSDPKSSESKSSDSKTADAKSANEKTSDQKPSEQKAENYYRPTLRRAKPTQGAPPDEVDTKVDPKTGKPESPAPVTGPIKFIPAISDDGGPEPKSYKFYWKTGEEDERRTQMLALAADELKAYTTALAKNSIPAKADAPKSTVSKAFAAKSAAQRKSAKPVPPDFENVQFNAFDVWMNNQPVMILTAVAHPAIAPGAATAPESYNIMLVARADIYGNLRKVYAGVTDKFHLDVTPKMELIDAVDADGDGRGELLFRQITDNGSGYVIFRPTADKLWKMFESSEAGVRD